MTTYYEAIAQYSGKDAGFVAYGRTQEECRDKAQRRTTLSVAIRRIRLSDDAVAKLRAVGKL